MMGEAYIIYIERKQEYAYAFFRIKMQRCHQYQRLQKAGACL
jgi:hypothetical protein